MPSREDETHRNLVGGHTRTCTCNNCERRRNGLPSRSELPEPIDATDEDWRAFFNSETSNQSKLNSSSMGNGFPTASPATTRENIQNDSVPLEIAERRRRLQADEREERMERERRAGTRSYPKSTSAQRDHDLIRTHGMSTTNPSTVKHKRLIWAILGVIVAFAVMVAVMVAGYP